MGYAGEESYEELPTWKLEDLRARAERVEEVEAERDQIATTLKALVESIYHPEERGVKWVEVEAANDALGQWCAICRTNTHKTNEHAVEVTA
jgi:hypothetical protein